MFSEAAKKALCEVPPIRLKCEGGKMPKCLLIATMLMIAGIFCEGFLYYYCALLKTVFATGPVKGQQWIGLP